MWGSETGVPWKHEILIAGLHKPATRWNQRRNVHASLRFSVVYDLVGLAALHGRVLRSRRPPQLRCSIHSLYNCLLARLMVKRDNPRNIPPWEEILELIKSLSQWQIDRQSQFGFSFVNYVHAKMLLDWTECNNEFWFQTIIAGAPGVPDQSQYTGDIVHFKHCYPFFLNILYRGSLTV